MENTSKSTTVSRKLYPYQERDINTIFSKLESKCGNYRLLYQLPTGGGKTVVFSEITKRFIEKYGQKVTVLTHRNELCAQTSGTLKKFGVRNKIINSAVSRIPKQNDYNCYVAMVETLRNRMKSRRVNTADVGLVIIDEAHHNSFRKLLGSFNNAFVIGVTATPFSADLDLPMHKSYDELITGESIGTLINDGFLATPKNFIYDVDLNTLKTGLHGDYTITSSDELYASPAMLKLLLEAYEKNAAGKKTLIFNNGIFTSKRVRDLFEEAGYPVRHLDNKTPAAERCEILKWFKKTKGAVLTSVSILTTGFDEPTVQAVILNRATTSLTLYYQMVGRGSRRMPTKKTFAIIDLGNNIDRFGEWHGTIDWKYVFENPQEYYEKLHSGLGSDTANAHQLASGLRASFPNTLELSFDIEEAYKSAATEGKKSKTVIQDSIRQHAEMCLNNAETLTDALQLSTELHPEIDWRVKTYTKLHGNATKNYRDWLLADYKSRLEGLIVRVFRKRNRAKI